MNNMNNGELPPPALPTLWEIWKYLEKGELKGSLAALTMVCKFRYDQLKREDPTVNRIALAIMGMAIFLNVPVRFLIIVPLAAIGELALKEQIHLTAKKMEWIWKETQTIPTVMTFAACVVTYYHFWSAMAIGYGVYIARRMALPDEVPAQNAPLFEPRPPVIESS